MEQAKLSLILKQASLEGGIELSLLDTILADDSAYDRSVEAILSSLEDPIRSPIAFLESAERKWSRRGHRGSPAKSVRADHYVDYVDRLRSMPPMTRDEETLFAKRMEFFRNWIDRTMIARDILEDQRDNCLHRINCSLRFFSAPIRLVCESLSTCPLKRTGTVMTTCQAYNKCRAVFVEKNLHIVVTLTGPYKTYGVPRMDLIQEGNAALLRAVELFDWRKKVRFQTYAAFWIRQAVERAIGSYRGIVRVPNYIQQKMRRIKRQEKMSLDESTLTVAEISRALQMPSDVVSHLLETERRYVSLDAGSRGYEEKNHFNLVAEEQDWVLPPEELDNLKKSLCQALGRLSKKERTIIRHRFGLGTAKVKTLAELGQMMNVSKERIRQIQLSSLDKLKKQQTLKKFRSYF